MKIQKNRLSAPQKVIISIIVMAFIVIIIAVVSVFITKPENIVKSKIEALSSNYYENYLYENILNSDNFSGNITETLEKYTETGFSAITLRELLLNDTKKTADIAPFIKEYCDENKTTIKFYPESPFTRSSYRANYSYSCEF